MATQLPKNLFVDQRSQSAASPTAVAWATQQTVSGAASIEVYSFTYYRQTLCRDLGATLAAGSVVGICYGL